MNSNLFVIILVLQLQSLQSMQTACSHWLEFPYEPWSSNNKSRRADSNQKVRSANKRLGRENYHSQEKGLSTFQWWWWRFLTWEKKDTDIVTRQVSLNESDPALLAFTIADKQTPPSKELFMARKSRFQSGTENHSALHFRWHFLTTISLHCYFWSQFMKQPQLSWLQIL